MAGEQLVVPEVFKRRQEHVDHHVVQVGLGPRDPLEDDEEREVAEQAPQEQHLGDEFIPEAYHNRITTQGAGQRSMEDVQKGQALTISSPRTPNSEPITLEAIDPLEDGKNPQKEPNRQKESLWDKLVSWEHHIIS